MLVGRNNDSSGPHGTTSNHQVGKRQHNSAAIQSPRKIGGFIPHCVVNVYRSHCFEEITHALVYLLADYTAKHLATDNTAIQDFLMKKPRTQRLYRIFPCSQEVNVQGRVDKKHCSYPAGFSLARSAPRSYRGSIAFSKSFGAKEDERSLLRIALRSAALKA